MWILALISTLLWRIFERIFAMTQQELREKLLGIQPALQCLHFLYHRILRDDYRGTHKLQHYRWNKDYIKIVLQYLPKNEMLYHTQGDIYEDYVYKAEELAFCEYLKAVNKALLSHNIGSITDMAMRKIIFVNLQRMGFIERFDKNKKLCEIGKTYRNYRYVKITQNGLDFIHSKDIFEEQKHLGIALDSLFGGVVQDILDIINELEPKHLSISEMMFFVSYLGKDYQGNILTKDMIIDFINEFRSLMARQSVVESVISAFCNPQNFRGNKTQKRDFHNWKNEAQSIFDSLNLMSLFEYDRQKERLFLRADINKETIAFKRSSLIKIQYFQEHEVQKDVRFELHHIVPFYYAKDIDSLKAIDDWQNLLYIDAKSHKILSLDKNKKKAIKLNFEGNNAVLDNLIGNKVVLQYTDNVRYKVALQERLIAYNKRLLGISE